MTAFKWNWQQKEWPSFSYDEEPIKAIEYQFAMRSNVAVGVIKHILETEKEQLVVELLSDEGMKTSEIEGDYLDRDSIQESIKRNLGISTDRRKLPPGETGIAEMMVHSYRTFDKPLEDNTLFLWHKMLTNGRRDLTDIGRYRTHLDVMQVVSGRLDKPKVHYIAPPSSTMKKEMKHFIDWFNKVHKEATHHLNTLAYSGIAHFYFLAIHPFEDGNGRIARALSEKSISLSLGRPALISLSQTIQLNKKAYYTSLETHNTKLDLTKWLVYFGNTMLQAQENTLKTIEFYIKKAKFFDRFGDMMSARQTKVALRIFKEGSNGFKGGLSAVNYMRIAKTSASTATRDLNDLVTKNIVNKKGVLKGTRYYLNLSQ